MFPLGGVLFPTLVLPLHVFEPRYRQLVQDCLAGEREFGVVLIERGSEVGGGDVRSKVGTVASIVEAAELDDGRWALITAGVRRLRVMNWLDDDPYPRAEVEDWPDATSDRPLEVERDEAMRLFRRVLGLRAELAEPAAPATTDLSEDPVLASYQMAALAGFGPADQQALLSTDGPEARLATLTDQLGEEADFLAQRLALG